MQASPLVLQRRFFSFLKWLSALVLIGGACSTSVQAQGHDGLYGNEWIDYTPGKQYFKIRIAQDGWYRVPSSALQQAGVPQGSIPLDGLQIFHNGKEIPIYVERNGNNLDYVQFYGEKNRGEYDRHCYGDSTHHFNEFYSLYHDTAAYFLTWQSTPSSYHMVTRSANLSNLPAKEPYFMHRSRVVYTSHWNKGLLWRIATERLSKSTFEYGEGYGSTESAARTTSIPTPFPFRSGPDATAAVKVFTTSPFGHALDMRVGGTTYQTHNFTGWKVGRFEANVPANTIQGTVTSLTTAGTANASDKYYMAYAELTYPRLFNFGGNALFPFRMAAHNSRKYLEINNVNTTNAGQNQFYLYDLSNLERIQCFYDGANNRLLTDLTATSKERDLVFVNEGNTNTYLEILAVTPVTFRNFGSPIFTPTNYVIITHPQLQRDGSGNNPIFDYRAYRQSQAGGNFVTAQVDIQELYDQFSYGIHHHPLAIRHFAHYMTRYWTNPEYIFLIGKGRVYNDVRNNTANMLIPTFGYPPSDNILVASVDSDEPRVAIGRLSATTGDQVRLYLQKIRDVEAQRTSMASLADQGWTKNILHLGGGRNSSEQNVIRSHLNNMKNTIEGPQYGGRVSSFFKTSTSPIQAAQSTFLDSLINSGVSMITFFGHSSTNSFDFNLDHPQNYSNYQKYPLVMALGCYGGSMFELNPLISEDFIFEPQAGAAVFFASSSAAALDALNQFGRKFYDGLGGPTYGEGAAKASKYAIRTLEATNYSVTNQMACHYMTYHGDPAYKVSTTTTPDYYTDINLVSHSPNIVTTQMATFNLEIDVYNLGQALDTAFNIRIERTYPDRTRSFVLSRRVTAPYFHNRFSIPIPVGTANTLGINYFDVFIDSDLEIDEEPNPAAENNNEALRYEVAILSDAIVPVFPPEFAIVPTTPITLKASTGNTFAQSQTYAIQMDTTMYFNSPLLQQTTITQPGGLLEWTPTTTYLDSTVYYWRVSVDSVSPTVGYQWASSSFIYINGSYPGWNQSHFFQYLRDNQTNITIGEPRRSFEYITAIQEVAATTAATPSVIHPENHALYFNGSKLDKCRCSNRNGVYVAIIEPGTLQFWTLPGQGTRYGGINCDPANRTSHTFLFETQTRAGQDSLENFIQNIIPNDHYVMAYTLNNAAPATWSQGLIDAFEEEGVWYIDDWINTATPTACYPWGTFFKKGDTTYAHKTTVIGVSATDEISISGSLEENWYQGTQTSTIIGPASYWGGLYWDHSRLTNDYAAVNVYGWDANKTTRTLLLPRVQNPQTTLSSIDPAQYPYLELEWHTRDSIDRTSGQLEYWRVTADLAPEATLRPDLWMALDSSCIQRGQPLKFSVAMENISDIDMDSMLVRFEILGSNTIQYARLDSLRSGDTLHASVVFDTKNIQGANQQLLVEINPDNDQREQFHFNNIGLLGFKVRQDLINPILDVTFDGIHIMNRDIVSGTPEIVVTLSDENQYLELDDLEDFSIILRHPSLPNGEMFLSTATTDMQFYPADPAKLDQENTAKIVMRPDLKSDGIYTLFVSATDQSGNNSGQLSYSVDFEVVNKPSITHLLNYPNPFTTSTQFVFTLTGRELPDYMKIQILTVTGKVVREIAQEELGPLRIGLNRTDYAWDGTDEYGDQLANGVYLYRVITKRNGQDYEMRSTRTDYLFRQGFGKMYLMR